MSAAEFSIEIEPALDLVSIRMSGFFNVSDVARFRADLLLAHRQLDCHRRGGPLTVNDVSGMAIQSQDVIKRWGEFLAEPTHRSRRLAFVVASALGRRQLQRAIGTRDAQVFATMDEAKQWLFSEQPGDPA